MSRIYAEITNYNLFLKTMCTLISLFNCCYVNRLKIMQKKGIQEGGKKAGNYLEFRTNKEKLYEIN